MKQGKFVDMMVMQIALLDMLTWFSLLKFTGQVLPVDRKFLAFVPHAGTHSTVVCLFHGIQLWRRVLCCHSNNIILATQGRNNCSTQFKMRWVYQIV